MDFCSLRHKSGSKVHWSGRIPHPPSFRLQGLDTLLTVYSLRALVSFVSRSPRPWDSPLRSFAPPTGNTMFPSCVTHLSFCERVDTKPKAPHGSARRDFWVLTQRRNLSCSRPEGRYQPSSSLEVLLPRVLPYANLGSPFREPPLVCLVVRAIIEHTGPALQSLDRLATGVGNALHEATQTSTTLSRFLHLSVPQHEDLNTPGYEFTSSTTPHYCGIR